MTRAEHTAGPHWRVMGQLGATSTERRRGRYVIASMAKPHLELATFARLEDARMAAASPEMFEALRECEYTLAKLYRAETDYEKGRRIQDALVKTRAALAKAKVRT